MKNFIFVLLVIISLGCYNRNIHNRFPEIKKLSKQQMAEYPYKIVGKVIFKQKEPIAIIQSKEWECFKGKVIQEISINILNDADTYPLLRWVYTKHPGAKIEINYDS